MQKPDEMDRELAETDALVREIAEYAAFVDGREELSENDLEFVTAAGTSAGYAAFLKKARERRSGKPGEERQ